MSGVGRRRRRRLLLLLHAGPASRRAAEGRRVDPPFPDGQKLQRRVGCSENIYERTGGHSATTPRSAKVGGVSVSGQPRTPETTTPTHPRSLSRPYACHGPRVRGP
ncbi:hypothetical protein CoHVHLJ_030 [Columbid alphaherpesvirus 1]|uniref:Uncharacterized protein n=1 Tax=Columbid alphaherpesvirus 1 TaxID=93386 RepID=A0A1V0M8G7_9ALPH|nr:hypothetical protein CoHVHLJ_030 [Columbid alphaherpesvirus 1]ARD71341.1 hypothetical protein CoHVHLJ_030 [Columbid alphaherpesvirus 1]